MSRCCAVINAPHTWNEVPQCPNEGFYHMVTFQRTKEGELVKFNEDNFCFEHSWDFAMYYSNHLGLKVIITFSKILPEKVPFT